MTYPSWLRGRTVVYQPPVASPSLPQKNGMARFLSIPKKILGFVWRVFKRLSMVIGGFILVMMILGIWGAMKSNQAVVPSVPKEMILSFTLDGALPERNGTTDLLAKLQWDSAPTTLDDVVNALDKAAKDPRVKAFAVKAASGGYDVSQLQSIRAAVLRFRAAGKKTYIYSESYGGSGYGLGLYYLASAFDEIWMQPVGVVAMGGVAIEAPYFKDAMAQFGVEGEFFHRKEYKNVMENMTANEMSPASREMMQSIVNDLAGQLIVPIKQSRPKISGKLDSYINLGLLTDDVALKEGFIDKLDYEDVLFDAFKAQYKDAKLASITDYIAVDNRKMAEAHLLQSPPKASVAIIPVEGMIVSGSVSTSPYGMQEKMSGAGDIVQAIEDAAYDKHIKTIILRVNSPGGSPTASETIHRAVVWAKTVQKKQIVVSMGAFAASGGYWISAPADKIYAIDSTLTGSIGVAGGKVNAAGLWNKLNVHWDGVQYGANANSMSMNKKFSASEQAQFEATLDNVYDYFIKRVAEGRKMPRDKVEQIARGRAYTGRQALALGLVDKIGGLDVVLNDIATAQKLSSRGGLTLVYLPQSNNPMELMLQLLSQRIGLSPFLEKLGVMVSPFILMGQDTRMVYDRTVVR